jgi:phosphoenolpyruvate synthase/pyruvate phosphate dikinase
VPEAWCIPVDWFPRALGPTRSDQLTDLFAEIAATLGHEAAALDARIATILGDLQLDVDMRAGLEEIVRALRRHDTDATMAVRSSTTVEDGDHHSHAGLYESYLHIADGDEARHAAACWRSFYSPRAILGRVRAGDLDPAPRMAVIVQRMAHPQLAGVAFTQDDETIVEAAQGTGDRLVAGLADAARTVIPHGGLAPSPYQEIARLAQTVQGRLAADADIEWAWNGNDLYLLQVRPVTAAIHNRASGPVFTYASLYLDDTLPPDLSLGDCTDVYLSYTAKRAPLYRLADAYGIKIGRGWGW